MIYIYIYIYIYIVNREAEEAGRGLGAPALGPGGRAAGRAPQLLVCMCHYLVLFGNTLM